MSKQFKRINKEYISTSAFTTTESIAKQGDSRLKTTHSLSVVLPAFNEEYVITKTVQ
jgi:hypothetical protein